MKIELTVNYIFELRK